LKDRDGRWRTSKATTPQIVERLEKKRMPTGIEASRQPESDFKLLSTIPEFRSARVSDAAKQEVPRRIRPRIWIAVAIGLLIAAAAGMFFFLPFGPFK
jgi:hypothetical protein